MSGGHSPFPSTREIDVTRTVYHFTFKRGVPMRAVEDALVVASLAADALRDGGRDICDAVRLPNDAPRSCVIDARTESGAVLLRVFFAFVVSMFGPRAFRVVTEGDRAERRRGPRPRRRCAACAAAGVAR